MENTTTMTADKARWDANCASMGLAKEDFGKEFQIPGSKENYTVAGFNPNATANSVIISRASDGKKFVIAPAQAKQLLYNASHGSAMSEEAIQQAKANWAMNCWRAGLDASAFGQQICLQGKFFTIAGYRNNATKNTILIRSVENGREYSTNPKEVLNALLSAGSH